MSGTYHSRVFTFVNKRTHQLKDSCAKGWRHLKVAAVWSGQILLYPLQILAQTARIFHPELPDPPSRSALPQPAPDINIEQALDLIIVAGHKIQIVEPAALAIDDWSFIDESLWNVSHGSSAIKTQAIAYSPRTIERLIPTKPTIQGLSSLLTNHHLVLVTTENDLLDILTSSQQQEIRRRIGIDLATTWQHTQIEYSDDHKALNPSINLAIAGQQIGEIDRQNLPQLAPPNLFDHIRNWFQPSAQQFPPTPVEIIEQHQPKSIQQLAPAQYSFTPQPPRIDRTFELPQLPPISAPDLIIESNPSIKASNFPFNFGSKFQPQWLKQSWHYYRDYLKISEDQNLMIVHQPDEFKLIPFINPLKTESQAKQITTNHHGTGSKQNTQIQVNSRLHSQPLHQQVVAKSRPNTQQQLEYHQDWIEATAEDVGYSRSPFTKFLAWIDQIVLSIENWLIKIWQQIGRVEGRG
jgi:hypothetical protein